MRNDEQAPENEEAASAVAADISMVPKDDAVRAWYTTYVERALRSHGYPEENLESQMQKLQQEMQTKEGLELLLWTWQHVDCREQVLIQDDFAVYFGIPMWELIHALEAAEATQECAVHDPYMATESCDNGEPDNRAAPGRTRTQYTHS